MHMSIKKSNTRIAEILNKEEIQFYIISQVITKGINSMTKPLEVIVDSKIGIDNDVSCKKTKIIVAKKEIKQLLLNYYIEERPENLN